MSCLKDDRIRSAAPGRQCRRVQPALAPTLPLLWSGLALVVGAALLFFLATSLVTRLAPRRRRHERCCRHLPPSPACFPRTRLAKITADRWRATRTRRRGAAYTGRSSLRSVTSTLGRCLCGQLRVTDAHRDSCWTDVRVAL
ncbi:hypothetical protein HPB50_012272 [Hyalomma asiaticum]|uniref:Uncharacterized protein n=1 Tax=Hyalomma asiaticum TaxID=266040 RepID=A0ACB7S6X2_HYAAI|nr:hypothetical protein HPB50_012272 [Hyalomma asiaticum]